MIRANAPIVLGVSLAIAVAVAVVQTVRINGFGVWPLKIEGLADQAAKVGQLRIDLKAAREAFDISEGLRGQEQAQDRQSFNAAAERCDDRVSHAIDAGRAIEEVVNYGRNSDDQGPIAGQDRNERGAVGGRAIVHADILRRIVGQAPTAAQAAGMPTGSDQPKAR